MQEACQDIATLHTYSVTVAPPWLSTQHTAYEGRSLGQCLRFETLDAGEKLKCRLGYGTLYSGITFKSKLKRKNVQALHYHVHNSPGIVSILTPN